MYVYIIIMRVTGVKKQMRIYNALVFVFFDRLKNAKT